MAKKMPRIQLIRRISLGIFLVAVTVLTILHQKVQNMPSIDALDPFGGMLKLYDNVPWWTQLKCPLGRIAARSEHGWEITDGTERAHTGEGD